MVKLYKIQQEQMLENDTEDSYSYKTITMFTGTSLQLFIFLKHSVNIELPPLQF